MSCRHKLDLDSNFYVFRSLEARMNERKDPYGAPERKDPYSSAPKEQYSISEFLTKMAQGEQVSHATNSFSNPG